MTDIDVDRYQGPLREATPSGHVGFDSLPDQVVNKATGAGFCFNILCIGETGIGEFIGHKPDIFKKIFSRKEYIDEYSVQHIIRR